MGWLFTRDATRKDIIDRLTQNQENDDATWTNIAKSVRGNVLWVVRERILKSDGSVCRYIICNLLQKSVDNFGWGYKDMDESMGPCYYTCPLKYLDMVPEVTNADWREEVRSHHKRHQQKVQTRRAIKVGDVLEIVGSTIKKVNVTQTKPLMGNWLGRTYKIPLRFIGEIIS